MNKGRRRRQAALIADIQAAIDEYQPTLRICETDPITVIEGSLVLSGPEGAFDHYDIRIEVDPQFPLLEPRITETGGRIPRTTARHVNSNGTCCVVVWEQWVIDAADTSFGGFLSGPLHDFFLSQWLFDRTGRWRFGERPHFAAGLVQAYAEVLGTEPQQKSVLYSLRLLAKDWPKGHWLCPCGSGLIIRKCHREEVWRLHVRVPPQIARQMLQRLTCEIGKEAARSSRRKRSARL